MHDCGHAAHTASQLGVADLRPVVARTAVAYGATGIDGNHNKPATDNDPVARMLPGLQAVAGKGSAYEPPLQMGSEDFP